MVRVDLLCDLYHRAYELGENKAEADLTRLVRLVRERGYNHGQSLLQPGLDPSRVRPLAWNVSSLLSDKDMERMGYPIK